MNSITSTKLHLHFLRKFSARLKQANLASKNDIANFIKKTDFDESLKTVLPKKLKQYQQKY